MIEKIKAALGKIKELNNDRLFGDNVASLVIEILETLEAGDAWRDSEFQRLQKENQWDRASMEYRAALETLIPDFEEYREAIEKKEVAMQFGFHRWVDEGEFSLWCADRGLDTDLGIEHPGLIEDNRAAIVECFWDRIRDFRTGLRDSAWN